jgi:hypothetical protein
MDISQALNAQMALVVLLMLAPTLGAMQARRMRGQKIRLFLPDRDRSRDRDGTTPRLSR